MTTERLPVIGSDIQYTEEGIEDILSLDQSVNTNSNVVHLSQTVTGTGNYFWTTQSTVGGSEGVGWFSYLAANNNDSGIQPNADTHFTIKNEIGNHAIRIFSGTGNIWFGNVANNAGVIDTGHDFIFDGEACFSTICGEVNPGGIEYTQLLELTNLYNAVSMTGSGVQIAAKQWYYDATTPAVEDLGTLNFFTEGNWTGTASTRDGGWSIQTALNGTLTTQLAGDSAGNVTATGAMTATAYNKVTITAPATGSTLTIAEGKVLTASNTLTFTGTDTSSVAFGGGGTVAYVADKLSAFAATSSSELAGVISDELGSGKLFFANTDTGWAVDTGTADKTAHATYAGQDISAAPTEAEVQAIDDRVVILSQQIKALKDLLITTNPLAGA